MKDAFRKKIESVGRRIEVSCNYDSTFICVYIDRWAIFLRNEKDVKSFTDAIRTDEKAVTINLKDGCMEVRRTKNAKWLYLSTGPVQTNIWNQEMQEVAGVVDEAFQIFKKMKMEATT